jgi:Ca2+:H+ antiporter
LLLINICLHIPLYNK